MADEHKKPVYLDLDAALDIPALHRMLTAPPKVRQRKRKPTLIRALREAKKAGVSVAGATIEEGKVTLTFGRVEDDAAVTPLEEWRAKRRGQG